MDIDSERVPDRGLAKKMAAGLVENQAAKKHLSSLTRELENLSPIFKRSAWPEQEHIFQRVGILVSAYEELPKTEGIDIVLGLKNAHNEKKDEWLLAKTGIVAKCGVDEYRRCINEYPVSTRFHRWTDEAKHALAMNLISSIDLPKSSPEALEELLNHVENVYASLGVRAQKGSIPEFFFVDQAQWSSSAEDPQEEAQRIALGSLRPSALQPTPEVFEGIGENPGHRFQLFLVKKEQTVTPIEIGAYSQPSEFRVSRRSVPNPDYQRLLHNKQMLQSDLLQAQNAAANAQNPFMQGYAIGEVRSIRSKLRQARELLNITPPQIVEPVFQTYEYTVRVIQLKRDTRFEALIVDHDRKKLGRGTLGIQEEKEIEVALGIRAHDRFNRHSNKGLREWSDSLREADVKIKPTELSREISFVSKKDVHSHVASAMEAKREDEMPRGGGYPAVEQGFDPDGTASSYLHGVVVVSTGASTGSGFHVSENIVVTNAHVVGSSNRPEIRNKDGRIHEGRVIASDLAADLALIEVRERGIPLPLFSGPPPVGSDVIAVGHPQGMEFTVTRGIVSASRSFGRKGEVIPVFQTDAAINPGNSGGPLIYQGEVLGVNTAILSGSSGIGFAVHVDRVRQMLHATDSD
ncbi:trypsin-like peptidase domain-containing protein [Halorhodospira sp. 9621]|uniref:S1C family serine protease n=1 Tax=Halorhodospira sp. 9621 TaxID=2899135 RepID=UPI001EE7C143|nr:trypsin-like peptidase domain-containing protein [Halorhodospira sp. 9621]MCG5534197.1 trypsin-like peptidase domain-containing protein [Halorhodospira sp. 9621]